MFSIKENQISSAFWWVYQFLRGEKGGWHLKMYETIRRASAQCTFDLICKSLRGGIHYSWKCGKNIGDFWPEKKKKNKNKIIKCVWRIKWHFFKTPRKFRLSDLGFGWVKLKIFRGIALSCMRFKSKHETSKTPVWEVLFA